VVSNQIALLHRLGPYTNILQLAGTVIDPRRFTLTLPFLSMLSFAKLESTPSL
jgi:hypothetical protein